MVKFFYKYKICLVTQSFEKLEQYRYLPTKGWLKALAYRQLRLANEKRPAILLEKNTTN
jgi:hypothetical protein